MSDLTKRDKRLRMCAAMYACCQSGGGSELFTLLREKADKWDIDMASEAFGVLVMQYQKTAHDEYAASLPVRPDYATSSELRELFEWESDHPMADTIPVCEGSWQRFEGTLYKFFPDE